MNRKVSGDILAEIHARRNKTESEDAFTWFYTIMAGMAFCFLFFTILFSF
jgi:hypothetical protein